MAVLVGDGRLTLAGDVGEHLEIDGTVLIDGFTYPMVLAALAEIDDASDLVVHINSGGGLAYEGTAIRSALAQRAGRTDIVIEGIAASAASLIAMAGDGISMAEDATMMIHDPAGLTIGTVADHEASIRSLDSLATSYARAYATRAGIAPDTAREIMRAETWYTAEEAVAAGFADAVMSTRAKPVPAFPYQSYAHAPERLVAMAKENGWRRHAALHAAPAAPTGQTKETPMPTDPKAGAKPADVQAAVDAALEKYRADRRTVMDTPEAKGREALADFLLDHGLDADATAEGLKLAASLDAAPDSAPADPVEAYDRQRTKAAGAGLGGPTQRQSPTASLDVSRIYAKRRGEG